MESTEVQRERLSRLFTAWVEFYKTRYNPEFAKFVAEDMAETLQVAVKESESIDEVREIIAYAVTQCGLRVLESLEQNVRESITGVKIPPQAE